MGCAPWPSGVLMVKVAFCEPLITEMGPLRSALVDVSTKSTVPVGGSVLGALGTTWAVNVVGWPYTVVEGEMVRVVWVLPWLIAWFTVFDGGLAEKVPLPAYVAVMGCLATVRELVGKLACCWPPTVIKAMGPLMSVEPSKKSTLPTGVPLDAVTVAVNFTGSP